MRRLKVSRRLKGLSGVRRSLEALEGRTLLSATWASTGGAAETVTGNASVTPLTITTPATYLVLDSTGTNLQIYAGSSANGTPVSVVPLQSVASIAVSPSTGNDTLVVDYSNGDPVPAGGISYVGGGSSVGDKLQVVGASAADRFTLTAGQVQHGAGVISYSNVINLAISAGSATATADLNLLGVTVGGQASLTATTTEHIGQLSISPGGSATLNTLFGAAIVNGSLQFAANGTTGSTSSLNNLLLAGNTGNWTGRVDLANNVLVVETTATNKSAMLATLRDEVAFGATHNAGIVSTALPANTVLAVIDAGAAGMTSFGGVNVDANAIVIAPEIPGDANLDGKVDVTDLTTVRNNFGITTSSWTSGNFDNAKTIDLTDLANVLNNFGKTLAGTSAASTSGTATVSTGSSGDVAAVSGETASAPTTPVTTTTSSGRHRARSHHVVWDSGSDRTSTGEWTELATPLVRKKNSKTT